ncbi:hypothetical protein ACLM5H_05065 [Fredinandcohnia humi]
MKKFYLFVVAIVASVIVAGCSLVTESDENSSEKITTEEHKQEVKQEESIQEESEEPNLKSYQVDKSEYTSLEMFVKDISKNWADDSEYRSYQDDSTAEFTLANSVLHYVNYFEKEIEEVNMTEEFNEWQQIAYEMVQSSGTQEEEFERLSKEFEEKMNEINSKF